MALEKIAQGGLEAAVDELWRIQTPDAAKALVTLLRHDTETLANRAAWHLASLLPQTPIEEELRELDLPAWVAWHLLNLPSSQTPVEEELRKSDLPVTWHSELDLPVYSSELDWIWTPFPEPYPSFLPRIAGQIGDFLRKCSPPDLLRSSSVDQNLSRTPDPRLVIPLCTIVEKPLEALPVKDQVFIDDLKNSLDTSPFPSVPYNLSQTVQDIVSPKNAQTIWGKLLQHLPPLFQLEVLYRLITGARRPDQRDWEYLLQPTQAYIFAQREHYRSILWLSAVASVGAVTEIVCQIVEQPDRVRNGFIAIGTLIQVFFWLTLRQGIETPWEPELLEKLGIRGLYTFWEEAQKLFQKKPLWSGIHSLYQAVNSRALDWDWIFMFAFALSLAFAGSWTLAVSWVWIGWIGVWIGAWAVAGYVYVAFF